jgi:hypothetical protein
MKGKKEIGTQKEKKMKEMKKKMTNEKKNKN